MDTQSSIESYHGALKRWLSTDVRGLQGRRVDWLVWRLCTPVSNHYMHLMERKFNGFVVNKTIENIVQKSIFKSRDITSIHMSAPTFPGGSWIVKSLDSGHAYEVSRPFFKYACCSCPWGLRGNFCKHQCAIILQHTDISESMLLEFCGTYFGTNRGGLEAMFGASVPDDFFEDEDEESCVDLDTCNISDAFEEGNECGDEDLSFSHGLTQESALQRVDEVLEAIKNECEEGGHQLALHVHAILSRVLTDVHKMRIQSNARDLHPNVVFERMDDDTPNSIKRLKDFHEKYMAPSKKRKNG